jgi:hypothetical protein
MSPWPEKRASHDPFTAASWFQVSTGYQDSDNQVPAAKQFKHHGYEIAERYAVSDTAWRDGGSRLRQDHLSLISFSSHSATSGTVQPAPPKTGSPGRGPR